MPTFLTVVYTINDRDAFEPTGREIFEQLGESAEGQPFAITAVSINHEMQRVHWMEQAAEHADDIYELRELIAEITAHPNIGSVTSLADLVCEE